MPSVTALESAAGSAVGTDILSGSFAANAGTFRIPRRFGVVGSSAVGNASVDLYIGSTFVARQFNTSSGANLVPLDAKDMIRVNSGLAAAPFEPMRALISKAGATNVLAVTLEYDEVG